MLVKTLAVITRPPGDALQLTTVGVSKKVAENHRPFWPCRCLEGRGCPLHDEASSRAGLLKLNVCRNLRRERGNLDLDEALADRRVGLIQARGASEWV